MTVHGIDVSHNNGSVTWHEVPGSIKFAYIKATEGTGFTDPAFDENVRGAKAHGLYVGPYHFYNPSQSPIEQARHFASVVFSTLPTVNAPGILPPVLDVETLAGHSWSTIRQGAAAFLAEADHLFRRESGLYSGDAFFISMGGHLITHGRERWIARYSTNKPQSACEIWQYDEQGVIPGIGGGVDLDLWLGSDKDLAKMALHQSVPKVVHALPHWYTRPVDEPLTGKDVEAIQEIVGVKVDGAYGPATKAAVAAWQKRHGLVADGVVGPKTATALG